jgi:hypothetical protein
MTEWKQISLSDLYDQIQKTETDLNGELWNFWRLIKIDPIKWTEKQYGKAGGGFGLWQFVGQKLFSIMTLKMVLIFQTIKQ